MKIANNTVVQLQYELRKDTALGDFVEKTTDENPLTFLFGAGQMLPEFESNLSGLVVGDTFSFGIPAEKAYGMPDPQAIVNLPKQHFVIDGKLADDLLVVGKVIPMRSQEGQLLQGTVKEVQEDQVIMDFNHPMAGTNLHFTGKITDIRTATESEIAHGHVHGPGGHQH